MQHIIKHLWFLGVSDKKKLWVVFIGNVVTHTGMSLAKIVETMCDKKIRSNIFIVGKFCKKCTYNIGGSKIVIYVYM